VRGGDKGEERVIEGGTWAVTQCLGDLSDRGIGKAERREKILSDSQPKKKRTEKPSIASGKRCLEGSCLIVRPGSIKEIG